jgi:hypothetical protein
MQKKKPTFQAIPNYSVSGPPNWNESKEVPAEQGWNDARLTGFLIAGAVVTVNCRRILWTDESGNNRADLTFGCEGMPWCAAMERHFRQSRPRLRQPCSLNVQAKYETFSSGRSYSLSRVSEKR